MEEIVQLKELSTKLAYLKSVIKSVEDRDKLDKNIIYEVVYSHTMLKDYIESGIDDAVVLGEVVALLNSFETLVESIPNDIAEKALEESKVTKLNSIDKIKYKANKEGFNGVYKKRAYECGQNSMESYIKTRAATLLIGFILVICVITGVPRIISDAAIGAANGIVSTLSESDESDSSTDSTDENIEIQEQMINYLGESVEEQNNALINSMSSLLTVISTVLLAVMAMGLTVRFSIDLMYINLPHLRRLIEARRLVSQDAINACETQPDGNKISYIKVKEPDRIKRNIALLNIMLEEYKHSEKLIKLSDKVKNKNYMSSKEYHYTIAQIEFIYDRVLLKDEAMIKSIEA